MSESERISSRQSERVEGLRSGQDYAFEVKLNYQGYLLEVEDAHFHLDSAVLLPDYGQLEPDSDQPPDQNRITGLAILYACYRHAKEHPEQRALVVGHTDRSGSERYNQTLSELRARDVRCALQGDQAGWVEVADEKHTVEDYQQILRWIAQLGWDCDPGPKDDKKGPKTRQGVRNFQEQYNQRFDRSIQVDGIVGEQTWGAFFDVYMQELQHLMGTDEEGVQEARENMHFLECPSIGCGEHFPIAPDRRENYRDPVDRRVEILFFDPGEEPPLDCEAPKATCEELYQGQRYSFDPLPAEPPPPPEEEGVPVHLEAAYTDPKGEQRAWPKGTSIVVAYDDGVTQEEKIGTDGALQFHAREVAFTLRFPDSASTYVAVSPPDSGKNDEIIEEGHVEKYHDDGWRVFKLPAAPGEASAWALPHSDWMAKGASNFEAGTFRDMDTVDRIGSEATPVQLVLDPHWLFVRFEFFDRVYGHSHHDDKRVSIPPVLLDGYRDGEANSSPDTRSNWMVFTDEREKTCQALPWILQPDPDSTERIIPDSDVLLRFEMSPDTFVVSEDEQTRRLEEVTDSDELEPGPDRLKYYDMPTVWQSQRYFACPAVGEGRAFEDLSTYQIAGVSNDPEKPLVFSLDDIVLTKEKSKTPDVPVFSSDGDVEFEPVDPLDTPADDSDGEGSPNGGETTKLEPISWTPDDRAALFVHSFAKNENSKCSAHGLYKPDKPDKKNNKRYPTPASGETTRNYIHDYPNWTRLVIAKGMLFDVFNRRTPDDDEGPTGARAALQLPEDTGPGPGDLADSKTFSEPFSELVTFFKQAHDNDDTGRFDMAMLRCCDVRDGEEIATNFQYFRYYYDFSGLPDDHELSHAQDDSEERQWEFGVKAARNIVKRWNGPDKPYNSGPAEIVPEDPKSPLQEDASCKLRVPVTWFVQVMGMSSLHKAHFFIEVREDVRAFMNVTGKGAMEPNENEPSSSGYFTAAHESGHAGSLEDEYVERYDNASYYAPGFESNIPGDPYAYDVGAMMEGSKEIRARYFWHVAEWLRSIDKQSGDQSYFVQHGKYKYRLPHHPEAPTKSYASVPLPENPSDGSTQRESYKRYLYPLGKDKYNKKEFGSSHTLDGIMIVVVKMAFDFPDWKRKGRFENSVDEVKKRLNKIFNQRENGDRGRWYVTGQYGEEIPLDGGFEKCALIFSPRFLVENFPEHEGDAKEYADDVGVLVTDKEGSIIMGETSEEYTEEVREIKDDAGGDRKGPGGGPIDKQGNYFEVNVEREFLGTNDATWVGDKKLKVVYNTRFPIPLPKIKISKILKDEFPRMLGIDKKADEVTASDLDPIVRADSVLQNAEVHTF